MCAEDISLIIAYVISSISMIAYAINGILQKRKLETADYTDEVMTLIAALTPGSIIVVGFIVVGAVISAIVEGPNWILRKLFKQKQA